MGISFNTTVLYDASKSRQVGKMSLLDCTRLAASTRNVRPIRSVNESTKEILMNKIQGHIEYDFMKIYKYTTHNGYEIETSDDVSVLTPGGWMLFGNLNIGDAVCVNGEPDDRYKDVDFLRTQYMLLGKTQEDIAKMCNCSTRTIRAYIKMFNLGRGDSGALFGMDNPAYKGDLISKKGGYMRTQAVVSKSGKCEMCDYEGTDTDIHHVDHDPTNVSPENLIEICEKCHRLMHTPLTVRHVSRDIIESKVFAGNNRSVMLQVEGGNFVANGYICRNV